MLADGTNIYTYGYNRIAQTGAETTGYFLDDATCCVQQVAIVLARSYSPYVEVIDSVGAFETGFGFTGELLCTTAQLFLKFR